MLRRYRDSDDFHWLWSRNGAAELLDPKPDTLLHICWDGFPEGIELHRLPLSPHLTPFDWVVSFARQVSAQTMLPDLRVAISRPWIGGAVMERGGCFGPLLAPALQRSFPWLRIFDRPDQVPEVAPDDWPTLRTALPWKGAAMALAQGLVGDLAHSVSHHDVNNALGPLLILRGLGHTPPPHPGLDALLEHATRLQLVRGGETADKATAARPATIARDIAVRAGGTLRLVLIDDQINKGWAEVVAALLDVRLRGHEALGNTICRLSDPGAVELWGAERLNPLVDILEKSGDADARYRLRLTAAEGRENGPVQEILLLDLRLAFEGDSDIGAVRAALARVTSAAIAFDRNGASETNWGRRLVPENPADGVGAEEDHRRLALLSLPARTVATADISMPIMIFSSTAQRTVVEALKPYRTVSTHFEKPQVLGYRTANIANDTALRFADALAHAGAVLEARRTIGWLGVPAPLESLFEKEAGNLNFDIFVDESGTEEEGLVTIAALIAVQPPERARDYAYVAPARRLVTQKLRSALDDPDETKEELKRAPRRVDEVLELTNCSLVSLTFDCADYDRTASVDDPLYSDFLYREILADVLEYVLYHYADERSGEREVTARLHLPTRIRRGGAAERRDEDEYWGRGWKEDRIYLIGTSDALPIAQRISSYYPRSGVRITRARCFEINNFRRRLNVPLHYLADAVANRPFRKNRQFIERGAYGRVTPAVRSLLRAARLARNGDSAGAVASAHSLVAALDSDLTATDLDRGCHVIKRLKSRLASAAHRMSGSQFAHALELIPRSTIG